MNNKIGSEPETDRQLFKNYVDTSYFTVSSEAGVVVRKITTTFKLEFTVEWTDKNGKLAFFRGTE